MSAPNSTTSQSPRKIVIIIASLVFAVIAGILYMYTAQSEATAQFPQPEAVFVKTSSVASERLNLQIHSIGSLSAINRITVSSQIPGEVKQILFKDGQSVKQGDNLIVLDDTVHQGELFAAAASLDLSKRDFERTEKLIHSNAISKQNFDKAKSDYKNKQALLKIARANLAKTKIQAPFNGVLEDKQISIGDFVQAGQALITLTDLDHLKVDYTVPEKYLAKLKVGQKVELTTNAYPGEVFVGKVNFKSHNIDPGNRSIRIQAIISNDQHKLLPGLFVTVNHHLGQTEALTIPTESLQTRIDGEHVYIIADGKAKDVAISVGQHINDRIQVLTGLDLNSEVIIQGQQKISDGSPVTTSLGDA